MKIIVSKNISAIKLSQQIRNEVFTQEQGIPKHLDLDGLDSDSFHSLAYIDKIAVGVARLTLVENKHAVMARIAVTKNYRGNGVSTKLIDSLLSKARDLSVNSIEVHAHDYLREYYERFGFEYIKQVEEVGEHQLIQMVLDLKST
ncbi:MAG: GNAT family N-acetyltransferase [Cocleimonas sp.]